MKPKNWDGLSGEEKKRVAAALLDSMRGQLILSQALVIAARTLRAEEYPEESNAQDMDILAEVFFPIYRGIEFANEQVAKLYKNNK